jgi:hypothetical protein
VVDAPQAGVTNASEGAEEVTVRETTQNAGAAWSCKRLRKSSSKVYNEQNSGSETVSLVGNGSARFKRSSCSRRSGYSIEISSTWNMPIAAAAREGEQSSKRS